MTIDLINNAALLLAICWLQSLISSRWSHTLIKAQLLSGIVFSFATVAVMVTSILIEPGLWLWTDSSMVVVSVSTLCYGPIAGGLAAVTGILYKLWIGGMAATGGVINLLISFAAGYLLRVFTNRLQHDIDWKTLLIFGLTIHAIGAWQLYYFHIPISSEVALPYFAQLLAIMAPTTVLLGWQLQFIERKTALERQIKDNERRLTLITQSIPDQLIIVDGKGNLADVIAPDLLARRLKEQLGHSLSSIDNKAYEEHYADLVRRTLASGDTRTDVYSANRRHLLGEVVEGETHHFESKAKPIEGLDDGEEVIVLTRDITERVKAEEKIYLLAHYDTLTELPNRHRAELEIAQYIERRGESRGAFTLIMFYLNDFNLFNQSLGAETGDRILCEITRRLKEEVGEDYFLSRYSGLEFAILKPEEKSGQTLDQVCARIHTIVEEPVNIEGALLRLGASIGTAGYPADSDSRTELVRKALLALQTARGNDIRETVHFDSSLDASFRELLEIKESLTRARENNELALHFQPFYNLGNHSLFGVESLIRWTHPALGVQDPDFFLKAAEQSGLITSIGAWGIDQACRYAKSMEESGLGSVTISANISLLQLADRAFANLIEHILAKTGLAAGNLILEISEAEITKNLSTIQQTTRTLTEMGVRLAIDNFGCGFSNLNLIKDMGISFFKIDRSYIVDIDKNTENRSIVTALVQIAKSLDIQTVAVGVEDEDIRQILEDVGVDMGQGYYYCKPLPGDELITAMKETPR